MMSLKLAAEPRLPNLASCRRSWLAKTQNTPVAEVWKRFRRSSCGQAWFAELRTAYLRCAYCDHSPGWTIDHSRAKSLTPARAFAWSNWRLACGDCNRFKSTWRVIDPIKKDPFSFIAFDLMTGAPTIRPGQSASASDLADRTIEALHLDNDVLNDGRRRTVRDFLASAGRLPAAGAKSEVIAHLGFDRPHRAILRELLVERRPNVNPWLAQLSPIFAHCPEALAWAAYP